MEYLTQRYAKYFYWILIVIILLQLVDTILITLGGDCPIMMFVLIFLAIINIMLLWNSIKFNTKQQFTECKVTAKILRFTIASFLLLHALCSGVNPYTFILSDTVIGVVIIELGLSYRIKTIEHLEEMANEYVREKIHYTEGG